jgi:hypothetical protein
MGSEDFIAVATKISSVFSDVTPCNPMKGSRRFVRQYRFRLQGRRVGQTGNQHEALQHVPPKRRLAFSGIRGLIS